MQSKSLMTCKKISSWYNNKRPGLGSRFFKAVKDQTIRIKKNPFSAALRYDDVRCAKVKGFPYLVHYKISTFFNTLVSLIYFTSSSTTTDFAGIVTVNMPSFILNPLKRAGLTTSGFSKELNAFI